MRLSDFDYNLPKELIAQYPNLRRDASRLLVVDRKKGRIFHEKFIDIVKYFNFGDLLVLNNTKVLPARVFGIRERTGSKIEFLLLKRDKNIFSVMVKPSKKFQNNELILFKNRNGGIKARIVEKNKIAFDTQKFDEIYKLGTMPLPPYIKRKVERSDFKRYQTVFANYPGSIAAPTAGLHFTQRLLNTIKHKGVDICYITLHVGRGTFKPVRVEDITRHKMEEEYFKIQRKIIEKIKESKRQNRRVFAAGTTACRSLETLAQQGPIGTHSLPQFILAKKKSFYSGWTNLFIYPSYQFRIINCLLTNFHLPKSTLFMLVCAFAGRELIMQAYNEAIRQRYRFYSYGDAMLII